jgi:cell division inhibitor SepF
MARDTVSGKEAQMAGMMRKGMSWLGLGPEEDYDDYDELEDVYYDDEPVEPVQRTQPRRRPAPVDAEWDDPEPDLSHGGSTGGIRVLAPTETSRHAVSAAPQAEPGRVRSVVRPLPTTASTKPHVVTPEAFNDAQEVGDWFKKRQPVIVNLQGLDRDLARRLLDFASGVAYGLGGTVERVASHVYLLTPADMEVSADDRRRITEGALVDETS